jgi:hypothetical protein
MCAHNTPTTPLGGGPPLPQGCSKIAPNLEQPVEPVATAPSGGRSADVYRGIHSRVRWTFVKAYIVIFTLIVGWSRFRRAMV